MMRLRKWILISLGLLISSVCYPQVQRNGQNDKKQVDVEAFLHKIRDILKEMAERAKQLEKKKKDEQQKKKIRKKILQRLTNPFYWLKRQHWKIEVKKPQELPKTQPNQQENTSLQKNNQTLQRQINTFLNKNHQFLPFKFPDLKQFFQKSSGGNNQSGSNSSTGQGSQTSTTTDTIDEETFSKYKAVKALYDQTIENLYNFWSMVWLIIKRPERFNYVKSILCSMEIDEGVREPEDIFQINTRSVVVRRLLGRASQLLQIFDDFNEFNGFFPSDYKLYKSLSSPTLNSSKLPLDFAKSVCYNISVFVYNGEFLNIKYAKLFTKMNECLHSQKKCENIFPFDITRLYYILQNYLKLAVEIYKRQLIQIFLKLCYKKCLCEDLGVSHCRRDSQRDGQINIEETIAMLMYESNKDILKVAFAVGSVVKEGNSEIFKINQCERFIDDMKNTLEKQKENVALMLKESASISEPALKYVVDEAINFIENDSNFPSAFSHLQRNNPKVFLKVVASSNFASFLSSLNNAISQLKGEVLIKKNKCAAIFLAYMPFYLADEISPNRFYQDVLQFLLQHNLDGVIFVLSVIPFTKIIGNETLSDFTNLLEKLIQYPYYIYQLLRLNYLQRCYKIQFPKRKVGEEEVEWIENYDEEIKKLSNIFSNENLVVYSIFNNEKIRELLKNAEVSLTNIESFLDKVHNKKVIELFGGDSSICADVDRKKCYEFLDKFPDNAMSFLNYCPTGDMGQLSIFEKFLQYCPAKLEECPNPQPSVIERVRFCYWHISNFYLLQKLENSSCDTPNTCKCVDDFQNKIYCDTIFHLINDNIWGNCCKNQAQLEKTGISIEDSCKYIHESVIGCCNILTKEKAKPDEKWMNDFINKNDIKLCVGIDAKSVKENFYNELLLKLGGKYFSLLKDQLKNLREVWNKKDSCD
jgi:hypothetical protein